MAVATSVLVAATALTASIRHAVWFARGDHSELGTILSLLLFTVPGVIIGGQICSAVIGILFVMVAALMLGEVILNVR